MKLSSGKATYPLAKQVFRMYDSAGQIARDVVAQKDEVVEGQPLLDLSGVNPVAISIDPFFFHISWDEEEEEEAEYAFEGRQLRVKGLKYEKLEISGMNLDLREDDDQRHEQRESGD